MAKASKYRARAATAESTSWEVAASLCFRSSYSLQKLSHISDKTMLQATSLIQAANFQERDSSQSQPPASLVIGAYDPAYCSVSLPSPQVLSWHIIKVWNNWNMLTTMCLQPLAPMETTVAERLFVVCTPGPPPIYALKDVFGRFGGLIDVYLLKVIITIDL